MSKKSFTLSELLLVVAILAISLGVILLALVQCFLLNEANRNLTVRYREYPAGTTQILGNNVSWI